MTDIVERLRSLSASQGDRPMTTREEWIALAERCEAATGPDRDLSAAICIAANYAGPNSEGATNIRVDPDFGENDLLFAMDGVDDCCNSIPNITGSLDAITALMKQELPGSEWNVVTTHQGRGVAALSDGWNNDGWRYAASPALALSAAFCGVMAAKETDR